MVRRLCIFFLFVFCIVLLKGNAYASNIHNRFLIVGFANRVRITNFESGRVVHSFPIINDYLAERLCDCDKIDVLENREQNESARINEILLQLAAGEIPADLKHMGPDYLIYGYLNDVGIRTSGQSVVVPTAGVSAAGDTQIISIRLSVKIVNVHTGKEVFVATGHGQSGATKAQAGYQMYSFKIGSKAVLAGALHNALYKAVQQIAEKIVKAV